jgi:two-component system KDP operon response regulator KdpE
MDFQRRILSRNGEEIHLAPKEFDLLAFMMKHMDAPLRHVALLHAVWGPEYGNELEYLRAYVRILRKKIEKDPSKPEYILTEPWLGYRFRNPSDPDSRPIPQDDD